MSIAEVKTIFDLASNGFDRLRSYQDPIRMQATRFLNAFEAHGIARQQIIRLLPDEIEIPPSAFSTVDSIKNHLSPALLDWTSEYLALERNWLDLVGEKPHKNVNGYKN